MNDTGLSITEYHTGGILTNISREVSKPWIEEREVIVRDYRKQELNRVVWDVANEGVLLCTEAAYRRAQQNGEEPVTVGFPAADVHQKRQRRGSLKAGNGRC